MKNLYIKLVTLCAVAAAVAVPQLAYAQSVLEEIIVTATRRAANVQDIPIAVTAVTPAQLERQGVDDLAELGNVSASFQLQSTQTEAQGTAIRIRGVGTTGNNIGLESAVGVFIDGVYQSRPGIAMGDLIDLEGIEVLRGPQGTLFGRNTTAGAVVIKTAKPDFEGTTGFVNATAGNFNAFGLQAGINLPATETLAFRVTGSTRERDGFLEAVTPNGGESYDRDRYQVRAQALWEPSEDFSLRLIADHQDADERCCASVVLSGPEGLPADVFAAALPAVGFDALENLRASNDTEYVGITEQSGFSAEVNWNLNDNVSLTYVGSYRDFESSYVSDEGTALPLLVIGDDPDGIDLPNTGDFIETQTHELRFNGTALDGKLDWLVGFYYSDEDILENWNTVIGADFSRIAGLANFGNEGFLQAFAGAGNLFSTGVFTPVDLDQSYAQNQFTQSAESKSIFTHLIYSVNDKLDLTLGLRYVEDEKNAAFNQLSSSNPACLATNPLVQGLFAGDPAAFATLDGVFGAGAFPPEVFPNVVGGALALNCFFFAGPAIGTDGQAPFLPTEFDQDFEDDELIYTLQAAYKATDDVLFYAGFTHGYKAGGFNLDPLGFSGGNTPDFRSELIDSYEIGVKSTINNGITRINAALFYSDLTDFQVLDFTGVQFQTFNVDDVTSSGIELEVKHGFSDALSGDLAVTLNNAEYGDNCDLGGTLTQATSFCGSDLSNSPDTVIVAGLTYELGFNSGWSLLSNINARYESDRRSGLNPRNSVGGPIADFDVQDAHTKVNVRLAFTSPNENLSFELWGVNITDEVTRSITFNTALLTGSRSAFTEDPRTYGVTARYKF